MNSAQCSTLNIDIYLKNLTPNQLFQCYGNENDLIELLL